MKTLKLNYYTDPGHGWVKVSIKLLHKLNLIKAISSYSYQRKDHAYLEEDCDLGRLFDAAKLAGYTIALNQKNARCKQSKIRSYDTYNGGA